MEEKREFLPPDKPKSFWRKLLDFLQRAWPFSHEWSGFSGHNERMKRRRRKTKFDK